MGKQGPCYHCGVTSTPLWRNGPPEKPVLCNACGSRWRTKGTLKNYTPLHARAGPDDYEDHRVSRVKSTSINKNKEVKLVKRYPTDENVLVGGIASDYNQCQRNVLDEDASNRSSTGSAISNSESCMQFGSADASDLTGPAQSFAGTQSVPSKKRTSVNRLKQSSFEKLTKDLYTIWHEQQSSCFSGTSEDDLLFDNEKPMVSVEIGHGSVLITHPNSNRDDESEASSLSVENKQVSANEAYSHSCFPLHSESKSFGVSCLAIEKDKTSFCQHKQLGLPQRDILLDKKVQGLGSHDSSLCDVDLNDVLNFEVFTRLLTNEEQQELLKYLPPTDTTKTPDSIKCMFDSPEFKENILMYRRLLSEGVFDLSLSGTKNEDCKMLTSSSLSNLSKSRWMEHYNHSEKYRNDSGKSLSGAESNIIASNNLVGSKRSCDDTSQENRDVKPVKIPKRVFPNATSEIKECIDSDGSCFSPGSLFSSPPNHSSSLVLNSTHFVHENSSDQDLLLDLPSNGFFPQAELLCPTKSFGQLASTSSSSPHPHPMLL